MKIQKPQYYLLLILAMLMTTLYLTAEEDNQSFNNGEDVTNPPNRFDFRLKYQTEVNDEYGREAIATLRLDQVILLQCGWEISIRTDIPYDWYRCPHPSQCGKNINHLDDSLIQPLLITPNYGKWRYAFGAKFIFPTAGPNLQIGDGKYQLMPTLAFRYDLGDWSPGAYTGTIIRYAFDMAGYKTAPYISKVFFQPTLNINLPGKWFLNSSPEMIYNCRTRQCFIPLDLMVGNMIRPNLVLSLEYEYGLVNDYDQYRQQVEFRVGLFY